MRRRTRRNRKRRWLHTYAVFLAMISVALGITPHVIKPMQESGPEVMLTGVLLWIGLLGTMGTALFIDASRRRDPGFRRKNTRLKYWGLIHFFKNGNALIADVVMFLSLTGFLLANRSLGGGGVTFAFLGVFVYAFGMHCMLNGLNYLYINQNRKKEGTCHEESQETQ